MIKPTNPADRLAQIEARAEKATKGPWRFEFRPSVKRHKLNPDVMVRDASVLIGAVAPGHQIRATPPGGSYPSADGEFIANAREDVPWLLAELRTFQQQLEERDEEIQAVRENLLGGERDDINQPLEILATNTRVLWKEAEAKLAALSAEREPEKATE